MHNPQTSTILYINKNIKTLEVQHCTNGRPENDLQVHNMLIKKSKHYVVLVTILQALLSLVLDGAVWLCVTS